MQIANPIYDVVFKYLMEDDVSAKMLISTIIGQEVESLDFLPQENTSNLDMERKPITVYKLDFSAKIKTPEGPKNVLIEIQKAKYAADIMRFRKYLGEQYSKKTKDPPLPIVTIYFLGYALEHTTAPVIRVNRVYEDLTTHQVLDVKEDFIETLSHDSYVIQIPYLDHNRRSDIEALLTIFDQKRCSSNDIHVLNIDEESYPELYRPLVRRLLKAAAEPKIRKTMDIEDEYLEELENLERRIDAKDKIIEENKKELEENKKELEENKKEIEQKDKALQEKDRALAEKERMIEELLKRVEPN